MNALLFAAVRGPHPTARRRQHRQHRRPTTTTTVVLHACSVRHHGFQRCKFPQTLVQHQRLCFLWPGVCTGHGFFRRVTPGPHPFQQLHKIRVRRCFRRVHVQCPYCNRDSATGTVEHIERKKFEQRIEKQGQKKTKATPIQVNRSLPHNSSASAK